MKHFTLKSQSWLTAILVMVLSAFCSNASAQNIYQMFDTNHLPATGTVTELPSRIQLFLQNDFSDASLQQDAVEITKNGETYKTVAITQDEDARNLVTIEVGSGITAPGEYKVVLPEALFAMETLIDFNSWTWGDAFNEAFELTYTIVGADDPEEDPEEEGNVAIFDFSAIGDGNSTYYNAGTVLRADVPTFTLTINEVSLDPSEYSHAYQSSYGYLQIRDAKFTIAGPANCYITKIRFIDGGESSYLECALENLLSTGYANGIWNGAPAHSVVFTTDKKYAEIYEEIGEEGEEEEVVTGYTEIITGARIAKIIVSYDGTPEGISAINMSNTDSTVYDLYGRRANATSRGIFVVNGKKMVR